MNKFVPLLLALLLVCGILYLVHTCGEPAQEMMTTISLPGGGNLSVPEGSFNFKLAQFLADTQDTTVPRTFVFDHLNFESGSTRITPESQQTMKDLTAILKAYPAVNVRLEGHTDNVGAKDANKILSQQRAEAIRGTLESSAIASARMETAGWGEERPIATNDTPEGRARNRRLEMTVLSK